MTELNTKDNFWERDDQWMAGAMPNDDLLFMAAQEGDLPWHEEVTSGSVLSEGSTTPMSDDASEDAERQMSREASSECADHTGEFSVIGTTTATDDAGGTDIAVATDDTATTDTITTTDDDRYRFGDDLDVFFTQNGNFSTETTQTTDDKPGKAASAETSISGADSDQPAGSNNGYASLGRLLPNNQYADPMMTTYERVDEPTREPWDEPMSESADVPMSESADVPRAVQGSSSTSSTSQAANAASAMSESLPKSHRTRSKWPVLIIVIALLLSVGYVGATAWENYRLAVVMTESSTAKILLDEQVKQAEKLATDAKKKHTADADNIRTLTDVISTVKTFSMPSAEANTLLLWDVMGTKSSLMKATKSAQMMQKMLTSAMTAVKEAKSTQEFNSQFNTLKTNLANADIMMKQAEAMPGAAKQVASLKKEVVAAKTLMANAEVSAQQLKSENATITALMDKVAAATGLDGYVAHGTQVA